MTEALQKAIKFLNAIEVALGRYAYLQRPGRWCVGNDAMILVLYDFDTTGGFNLHTAEQKEYVELPSWWTPDQRFAIKELDRVSTFASYDEARTRKKSGRERYGPIVTVNYETGEEVSA